MLLFFTTLQINVVWKFRHVLIFKSRRDYRTFKITGIFQKSFPNIENAERKGRLLSKTLAQEVISAFLCQAPGTRSGGQEEVSGGKGGKIFFFLSLIVLPVRE